MHEDGRSRPRDGRVEEEPHAIVLNRIAVHGGEQADHAEPFVIDRTRSRGSRLRQRWIHHEEPDEAPRMPADGGGNRGRVAGHAGDERRARHAMTVEFNDPSVRELLGRAGPIPAEPVDRELFRRVRIVGLQSSTQRGEEPGGEEVAVGVVHESRFRT